MNELQNILTYSNKLNWQRMTLLGRARNLGSGYTKNTIIQLVHNLLENLTETAEHVTKLAVAHQQSLEGVSITRRRFIRVPTVLNVPELIPMVTKPILQDITNATQRYRKSRIKSTAKSDPRHYDIGALRNAFLTLIREVTVIHERACKLTQCYDDTLKYHSNLLIKLKKAKSAELHSGVRQSLEA